MEKHKRSRGMVQKPGKQKKNYIHKIWYWSFSPKHNILIVRQILNIGLRVCLHIKKIMKSTKQSILCKEKQAWVKKNRCWLWCHIWFLGWCWGEWVGGFVPTFPAPKYQRWWFGGLHTEASTSRKYQKKDFIRFLVEIIWK